MASEPVIAGAKVRVVLANTLSTFAWVYMSLLAGVLILKGAFQQLDIPLAAYIGIAAAILALVAAALVARSIRRSVLVVGSLWILVGLLARPFVLALATAVHERNWLLGVLLVCAYGLAASCRVKFEPHGDSGVGHNQ